ncbi:hypothetical protein Gogos_002185, partial [Gossypium gossypioides]|nr:hypothetical protein [Gossypium gossypioides]
MVVGLDQIKTASNAMLMQRCTLRRMVPHILWDHSRAFIQGFSYLFPFTLDPCMTELLATQEILLWLKDEHFDNVLIELFCKYAIVALCLSTLNFSEFGVILQDC